MFALRFNRGVAFVSVAACAAALSCALAAPASADPSTIFGLPFGHTAATARATPPPAFRNSTLKRNGTGEATSTAMLGASASRSSATVTLPQFSRFAPAGDPTVGVHGQVPLGRSHVYLPYYGDVAGAGPSASMQGVAGLGYGFGSWNLSVVNRGLGTDVPSLVQSMKSVSPSLTLSLRF